MYQTQFLGRTPSQWLHHAHIDSLGAVVSRHADGALYTLGQLPGLDVMTITGLYVGGIAFLSCTPREASELRFILGRARNQDGPPEPTRGYVDERSQLRLGLDP